MTDKGLDPERPRGGQGPTSPCAPQVSPATKLGTQLFTSTFTLPTSLPSPPSLHSSPVIFRGSVPSASNCFRLQRCQASPQLLLQSPADPFLSEAPFTLQGPVSMLQTCLLISFIPAHCVLISLLHWAVHSSKAVIIYSLITICQHLESSLTQFAPNTCSPNKL